MIKEQFGIEIDDGGEDYVRSLNRSFFNRIIGYLAYRFCRSWVIANIEQESKLRRNDIYDEDNPEMNHLLKQV